MPYIPPGSQSRKPSCWEKVKIGLVMGSMVGAAGGVLLGGFSAFRMGMRGKEWFVQAGKIAASMSGTFGVFMGVGTAIRC